MLNERYEVGRLLHYGNNSVIFKCTDITKRRGNKMVVKIFDQGKDEMINEIKTLVRLRKIQKKKYADEGKGLIPRQYYFGSLIVTDEGFQK